MKSRYQRSLSAVAFTLFMGIGTYNAVVINSQSSLIGSDIRLVKRLDELHGVNDPTRLVAASVKWQKLNPQQVFAQTVVQEVKFAQAAPEAQVEAAPAETTPVAAVQEDLNLNLVEVVNPKKWQQGLVAAQFNGTLSTNKGTIESLSVTLPGGEGLSISFSEMNGNVFEYDMNGEIYAGMMYQVDQTAYMVSLTNGPLEGTRLRFVGDSPEKSEEAQAQEIAQQGTNNENDNYGQPAEVANTETDTQGTNPAIQAEVGQDQQNPAPEYNQEYAQPMPLEVAFEQPAPAEMADPANLDAQYQQQGLQVQGDTSGIQQFN